MARWFSYGGFGLAKMVRLKVVHGNGWRGLDGVDSVVGRGVRRCLLLRCLGLLFCEGVGCSGGFGCCGGGIMREKVQRDWYRVRFMVVEALVGAIERGKLCRLW